MFVFRCHWCSQILFRFPVAWCADDFNHGRSWYLATCWSNQINYWFTERFSREWLGIKDVVHIREMDQKELGGTTAITGTIGFIANILWVLTFLEVSFLMYLTAGWITCITIIGIPFGIQAFKLAGISFWPVGRRVVTKEMAVTLRQRAASKKLDDMEK